MRQEVDAINSVDLDTLPAGRLASLLRTKQLFFDAHELFTELPELSRKPIRKSIWKLIEYTFISGSMRCYTVNDSIAQLLQQRTKKSFGIVQNYPIAQIDIIDRVIGDTVELVYQGMFNKGRGLEELMTAVGSKHNLRLHLIGRGDLDELVNKLAMKHQNIHVHGFLDPASLHELTSQFHIGFNLLSENSANYYYSSANKFFDYINAGLPVISMNFPEYRMVNEQYHVAELIDDLSVSSVTDAINLLVNNYEHYAMNCRRAAKMYTWESQECKLIEIYQSI